MEPPVILIKHKSTVKPCIPSCLAVCLSLIWPNLPSLYTEVSVTLMVSSHCLLQLESGFVCAACAAQPIHVGHSEFRPQECLYLHLRFHPACPQLPLRCPCVSFDSATNKRFVPALCQITLLVTQVFLFPFSVCLNILFLCTEVFTQLLLNYN